MTRRLFFEGEQPSGEGCIEQTLAKVLVCAFSIASDQITPRHAEDELHDKHPHPDRSEPQKINEWLLLKHRIDDELEEIWKNKPQHGREHNNNISKQKTPQDRGVE